jgi:hypothetical protein
VVPPVSASPRSALSHGCLLSGLRSAGVRDLLVRRCPGRSERTCSLAAGRGAEGTRQAGADKQQVRTGRVRHTPRRAAGTAETAQAQTERKLTRRTSQASSSRYAALFEEDRDSTGSNNMLNICMHPLHSLNRRDNSSIDRIIEASRIDGATGETTDRSRLARRCSCCCQLCHLKCSIPSASLRRVWRLVRSSRPHCPHPLSPR